MPFRPAKSRSGRLFANTRWPALGLAALASAFVLTPSAARAADTEIDVIAGATDLTSSASYTPSNPPSAAYDITFTAGTAYTTPTGFTINSNVAFGSLNDLNATALAISNTGGAAVTLTLGGTGDVVTGSNTADLLYVASGANLTINGGSGTSALGIALATNGNFDVAGTANISSVISGAFAITKTGNGALTLSGANTYSGNTTISAGTVKLGSSSVGTASTVGSNGALTSGALGTGSVTINGQITLDLNGQTFGNRFVNTTNNTQITNTSATTAIISGAMDGSLNGNVISDFSVGGNAGDINWTGKISRTNGSFSLTKIGSNTVNFTGTTASTGIGTIFVNAGTVGLGVAASAAAVADSATVAGGTLKFRPDLGVATGGNPWAGQLNGTLTLNSGTVDLFGSSGQNSRQQQFLGTGGTLTNTSATAGVLGISARNNAAYNFAGTIQDGTGTVGIDFSNQGNANSGRINIFSGTNTYSGTTTISYGTYELGSALASQNSTLIVNTASGLGTNGTYAITTTSPLAFANGVGTFTVGGLSGAGNFSLTDIGRTAAGVTATAATVTLQVGSSLAANAAPAAYSGVISDGTVAGGSVTKIGSSTEIFSGANTYTGATIISAGILQIGAGGATGSLSTSSTITDNGTLAFNRTGTVTQGTDFSGAAITGSGTLTKAAAGTLVLNAANTYAGGTSASAGTIQLGSSTNAGTLTSGPLGTGTVQISTGSGATLDLNGQTLSNAFITGGNGAVFTNSSASVATVSNGFNAAGTNGVVISDFTVNGTGDINWSGSIRRTNFFGTVTKNGTNTLTFSGAGTGYTNFAYNVSGGTLAFNMPNGSTFNSGNIANTANVAGTEATGVTNTIAASITGTGGTFTQSGAGTTILSVANTYTGATTISGGTLSLGVANTLATTSGITVTAGRLTLAATNALATPVATTGTSGNPVSVAGQVPISLGGGTLLRTGAGVSLGSQSGTTGTVGIGMLTLTAASALDFGTTGTGTLNFNSFTDSGNFLLTVTNYSRTTASGAGVDGTDDRLIFNQNMASFLPDFSINGQTPTQLALGNGEYELIGASAVPEPSTWVMGLLTLGALGFRLRRHLHGRFAGGRAAGF